MDSVNIYGSKPYTIALLHGGPGAAGEMGYVSKKLSEECGCGVLEPLQTSHSVDGQIKELHEQLISLIEEPIIIAGYSWGAWLAWMYAAQHPELVKNIILISSGPFTPEYAKDINRVRYERMTEDQRIRAHEIEEMMARKQAESDDLKEYGSLMMAADTFKRSGDVIDPVVDVDMSIYNGVWPNASKLRENGELLQYAYLIKCPVIAIHGDYDAHPAAGVRIPLQEILKDFTFHILEKCGHTPWRETYAKDEFFRLMKEEIEG